jgi:hypothetical protein
VGRGHRESTSSDDNDRLKGRTSEAEVDHADHRGERRTVAAGIAIVAGGAGAAVVADAAGSSLSNVPNAMPKSSVN